MELWVARNANGGFRLFAGKPSRNGQRWLYMGSDMGYGLELSDDFQFRDMSFSDDPVKVRLHMVKCPIQPDDTTLLTDDILRLNGFDVDDEFLSGDKVYKCAGYGFDEIECFKGAEIESYKFIVTDIGAHRTVTKHVRYAGELIKLLQDAGYTDITDNFRVSPVAYVTEQEEGSRN